jgi:nitroreductase
MVSRPLTRRDFLKVLGLSGGTLLSSWLLPGCAARPAPIEAAGIAPTAAASQPPALTAPAASSDTPSPAPSLTPSPTSVPAMGLDFLPPATEAGKVYLLPAPRLEGGTTLMQALLGRHSTRAFRPDELPVPILADLLWAAFGVNRPQTGGRTAPSAYDFRDIDVYLAAPQGLFRYAAESHSLTALLANDLRADTGTQAYVATAPLNLVYVSDYRRMTGSAAQMEQWSWAHSGCIAQNVYLYCSAYSLACVVRSTIDRDGLARRMKLDRDQHIVLAQTLGYPAAA